MILSSKIKKEKFLTLPIRPFITMNSIMKKNVYVKKSKITFSINYFNLHLIYLRC